MFNSYLNLDAGLYEAIIAAFVVLGLIQSVALARKYNQCQSLKADNVTIAKAATKAIVSMMADGLRAINKSERRARDAERTVMEMQADIDDANDNARNRDIDPQTLIFGDSHFGVGEPARNNPADLHRLFSLLDGPGRNGSALDELLTGRDGRRVHVVHGGDFLDGPFTNNLGPGERNLTLADLEAALGAKCIGVDVFADGREIHGAEKDDLIRTFLGADFGATPGYTANRPSFDIDPAELGTRVHENIERILGDRAGADTLKAASGADFDPRAHGTVEGTGGEQPDESCSTQQPRSYGASSPRAG